MTWKFQQLFTSYLPLFSLWTVPSCYGADCWQASAAMPRWCHSYHCQSHRISLSNLEILKKKNRSRFKPQSTATPWQRENVYIGLKTPDLLEQTGQRVHPVERQQGCHGLQNRMWPMGHGEEGRRHWSGRWLWDRWGAARRGALRRVVAGIGGVNGVPVRPRTTERRSCGWRWRQGLQA